MTKPLKRHDVLAHRELYGFAAVVLYVVLCIVLRRFTIDDAFIAYRHAHHLGSGLGLVMNASERVEGVSNLPWAVLLGFLAKLGLEPHTWAPVLSVLCGLVCLGLVQDLTARVTQDPRAGGLAALVVAVWAPFAAWGVSGMETLAYTAVLLGFLTWSTRGLESRKGGFGTGLLWGFLSTLRPEGLVLGLPLLVAEIRSEPPRKRRLVRIASGLVLVLGVFLVLRFLYYGDWLANPVYAKAPRALALLQPGLVYVAKSVVSYPLLFLAMFAIVRGQNTSPTRLLLGTTVLAQLLFAWGVGGDRFPGYRFLVPVWPLLGVAAEVYLRDRRQPQAGGPGRLVLPVAIVLGLVGVCTVVWPARFVTLAAPVLDWARVHRGLEVHTPRLVAEIRHLGVVFLVVALWSGWRTRFENALQDVRIVPGRVGGNARGRFVHESKRARQAMAGTAGLLLVSILVPGRFDPQVQSCRKTDPAVRYGRVVGLWLRDHARPGTLVATNAAGSLPYFSELPVLDMLGLTDRHIARRPPDKNQWIGHEKGDAAYVLKRQPDLIILGGPEGSAKPWPFPGDQALAVSPEFQTRYQLQRVALSDFEFVYYRRRDSNAISDTGLE